MLNNITLMGRLTADPELRSTNSGTPVATFTLAVDRDFSKDKQTDFINCVAWRQNADFLGSYARKGAIVGVDGRIQCRTYDGRNGKQYITEVVADSVQLIESARQTKQAEQPKQEPAESGFDTGPSLDVKSDDLPF